MDVIEIDGSDRELFERYHRLMDAVQAADSEFPTMPGLEETWVWFTARLRADRVWGLAAVDGDTWLGAAWLQESLLENTDILQVDIQVDPAYRRRGVGTRLLRAVEDVAREHDRTVLQSEVVAPYDERTTTHSPGTAFAERHGFVRKHLELHQVMEFPLPDAELDRIAAEIAPKHAGYRIVQWYDACPDEWIVQIGELWNLMFTDAPRGDLEGEPILWTPERMREREARHRDQNRFRSTTAAVAPDGTLAAFTEMSGSRDTPGVLSQAPTLVRSEHRGHRLGMAVKIVNLRALQALVDTKAVLHTWNAPENAPMIAVNDRLGFRPVENNYEYQRRL
jgi:GNAT superfamily N-acetyltransferase